MTVPKAPHWNAPPTLLPAVMTATSRVQPVHRPVTVGGICLTAALCAGVAFVAAVMSGMLPIPFVATGVEMLIRGSDLLMRCERVTGTVIRAIAGSGTLLTGTLIYLSVIITISIAAIRGLVYICNLEPITARSAI